MIPRDSMIPTGNTRFRTETRGLLFKSQHQVLQVEMVWNDGPGDSNGMPEYLRGRGWFDARTEDITSLDEMADAIKVISEMSAADDKVNYSEKECFVADAMHGMGFENLDANANVFAGTLGHIVQLLTAYRAPLFLDHTPGSNVSPPPLYVHDVVCFKSHLDSATHPHIWYQLMIQDHAGTPYTVGHRFGSESAARKWAAENAFVVNSEAAREVLV